MLEDLDYADDICLLSQRRRDMMNKLENLVGEGKINIWKTKAMTIGNEKGDLRVGDELIKNVEEFTYLGSKVTKDGGTERDVQCKIRKAKAAFAGLTTDKKYEVKNFLNKCEVCGVVW